MQLPFTTPVEIETSLPRTEVIDRLTSSIDTPGILFMLFGPNGLVGRVGPDRCWFENGSLFSRNDRRLTLYFSDIPQGTTLKGYFALPMIQLIPLLGIFAVGSIVCLVELLTLVLHPEQWTAGDLTFHLIPFALLISAAGIVKINLWFGQRREQELVEILTKLLKAPPRSGIAGTDIAQPQGGILIRPRHQQP